MIAESDPLLECWSSQQNHRQFSIVMNIMKSMSRSFQPIHFFTLLALALLGVSFPVLQAHPTLDFDDFALLDPLRTIQTLEDYLNAWSSNLILDLAPIRDLSYWIELKLEYVLGFRNSQWVNLIIWYLTLVSLSKLLTLCKIRKTIQYLTLTWIGLHPVIHSSIFWTSGRKHVLSALWITLGLYFLIKAGHQDPPAKKRHALTLSGISYLISLNSQPINIGFPIFALLWITKKSRLFKKPEIYYLISISILGMFYGLLNFLYYTSPAYLTRGGIYAPKFRPESLSQVKERILIIGRFFYQILTPIKPSVISYNIQGIESQIGLVLLLFFVIFMIKFWKSLQIEWLIFAVLPLAVVTTKLTSQGGLDTYLLSSLIGCALFIASTLNLMSHRLLIKKKWIAAVIIMVIFLPIDLKMAVVWSQDSTIWEYAYEAEGNNSALAEYARSLVNSSNPNLEKAKTIALNLQLSSTTHQTIDYVLGKVFYLSPLSYQERTSLFQKYHLNTPWFDYYWSALDAQNNQYKQAYSRLERRWLENPSQFALDFQFNLDELENKWTLMCHLANNSECNSIHNRIVLQKSIRSKASHWF